MAFATNTLPPDFHLASRLGIAYSLSIFAAIFTVYFIYIAIYNIFFHPLKHIPGPLFAKITTLPYVIQVRKGTIVDWLRHLHEKYGDAVRVTPTDVSLTSAETAWHDVYGFRTGKYKNTGPYYKDNTWFAKPVNGVKSIVAADGADHTRVRRTVAYAFSDKALREQESLIQPYVDLLVHRLGEESEKGQAVNIARWYNFTTFDVISDLTFGQPLYCLRDSQYHEWVTLMGGSVRAFARISTGQRFPLFRYYDNAVNYLKGGNKGSIGARREFFDRARNLVDKRIESGNERPDFFHHILKNNKDGERAMTRDEMDSSANSFLAAGSETTATTLSGCTYLLLKHPECYAKAVQEVRSRFTSADQITMDEVHKLDYMIACLSETLRVYPPIPTGFPRIVPPGGDRISGIYFPEGVSVYVSQHASNHSSKHFKDADSYVPARWLGDEKYKDDKLETVNPFSFGPRACLGKNLALAEMRLILAKILWNFDLSLEDPNFEWIKQRCQVIWEKPDLMVHLKPVQR